MSLDFKIKNSLALPDIGTAQLFAAARSRKLDALSASHGRFDIVVIEDRTFARDCLVKSLNDSGVSVQVHAFASVEDFAGHTNEGDIPTVFILCSEHRNPLDVERDCAGLSRLVMASPMIVLLAQDDNAERVLSALRWGVKGYVPLTLSFECALDAIRIVRAGGIYIPADCLAKTAAPLLADVALPSPEFTSRQRLVVEAMRRGKSNKIIAYELQMAEATVKVHVSNIMRKLKARNRTEVAVMINAAGYAQA